MSPARRVLPSNLSVTPPVADPRRRDGARASRSRIRGWVRSGVLGALLCICNGASAHVTQLSSARLDVSANAVSGEIEVNARDLGAALGEAPAEGDEAPAASLVGRRRDDILRYLLSHVRVLSGDEHACATTPGPVDIRGDHVVVRVAWRCPPLRASLVYEATLFHEIDPVSRHMLTVTGDQGRGVGLLSIQADRFVLGKDRSSLWSTALHYVHAGFEHIAIGYDHIAFLVAVVVWGRRLWPLVQVVTAFTVAHSVTLSLAVLGWVQPPSTLVEVLIALSIVFVAVENFMVRDLRGRWRATFVFGLVHGFGFASVLRDYGLPPDALVLALGAFNVGVEIGQLAIVAGVLSVLFALRRLPSLPGAARMPGLEYLVSGAVGLLGLYWAVRRLAG